MSTGLTPNTREEMYLSAAAGEISTSDLPTPATRKEKYLNAIANNGGGGGGGGFTPTDAQLAAMNSGITAEKLQEDEAKTVGMTEGGSNYITVNGIRVYVSATAPTGARTGDLWIGG